MDKELEENNINQNDNQENISNENNYQKIAQYKEKMGRKNTNSISEFSRQNNNLKEIKDRKNFTTNNFFKPSNHSNKSENNKEREQDVFSCGEFPPRNKWENEKWIIKEFSNWLRQNHKVSDNELFTAIDYDSDGIIALDDFKNFLIKRLNFSKYDFNNFQLEKTLQTVSLNRNKHILLSDLQDFIKKNKLNIGNNTNNSNNNANNNNKEKDINNFYANNEAIKSPKITIREQNNNNNANNPKSSSASGTKENYDYIFEKLGIYVFENHGDIEKFFNENSKNGKMLLENLQNFFKKNSYSEGLKLSLTPEEVYNLFIYLDMKNDGFIEAEVFKKILSKFNFYEKMHQEIKNFISSHFKDGIGAFKYFMKKTLNSPLNNNNTIDLNSPMNNANLKSLILSNREFYEALNNLFPRKYLPSTLMNYIRKKFRNFEEISFSEFNFVYFDEVKNDSNLIKTINSFKNYKDKAGSNYFINNKIINNNNYMLKSSANFRSKSLYASENMGNKLLHKLETPFDEDPLEKIRRIIYASRFDFTNYFKMYDLLSLNGMVNHNEFKNILKKMNVGITSVEIDHIASKAGMTRSGMISIRDFVKYLQNE